jgi:hypothetical protein
VTGETESLQIRRGGRGVSRFNVARLLRLGRRLAQGPVEHIKALAERQWTVAPGESSRVPPALHLDGAIERIAGLSQWRHWDVEQRLIDGDLFEHAPSVACLVRDVDLAGAYLYKAAAIEQPGFGRDSWWLRDGTRPERLPEAELVSSSSASRFFGCWLLEEMPLALLLAGQPGTIRMRSPRYEHEAGYRELLDLPPARLVHRARIDQLILHTDFGQNRSREARYRELRSRLRRHAGALPGDTPQGIYLRRRGGEPRVVVNEPEVEALMRGLGFRIVDPSALTAAEVARQTLDAPIVVSVEGSHISHAIYSMADDATLVVLQPPQRFSLAYKEYTDRMAMRFAFVVGRPHPDGFVVAPDDIERTIELVSRAACRCAA